MALKFLNKKGWHTGSLRNIENVWKAEQKHEAEQKKLEELRKQIHEEKERAEFRQLQEQAGLVPKQERLDFLYESGLAVGKASASEGFKALEAFPKPDDAPSSSASASSKQAAASSSAVPGALFEEKPHSANDAWRKLHSDPLLMIRQREQEALARIKNNPVQMAMIRKSVEEKKKKKSRDEKEHRRKHHHSSSKHQKHSSSSKEEERRNSGYNKSSNHDKHSDSEDESHRKSSRSEKNGYRSSKYKEQSPVGQSDPETRKDNRDYVKGNHDRSEKEKYPSEDRREPQYRRRNVAPKLLEEERAARLREMQMDAELHEEQRWKRLKKADDDDAREASQAAISRGKNFLDAVQKSVYGTEKGGSSSIAESVRRRTHYSQGRVSEMGSAWILGFYFLLVTVSSSDVLQENVFTDLSGIHLKLYHAESNSSLTRKSWFQDVLAKDEERFKALSSRLAQNEAEITTTASSSSHSKRLIDLKSVSIPLNSGLSIGSGNYFVKIGLGSPASYYPVIMDTGSSFSWLQCQPCEVYCHNQAGPIFDPSASQTYKALPCSASECSSLKRSTLNNPLCNTLNTCIYTASYGDASFSIGYLSQDKLTLTPSQVFPRFVYGCGQDNQGLFGRSAGIIGLARDKLSLLGQVSYKYGYAFSYCLPSALGGQGGVLSIGTPSLGMSSSFKFTPLVVDSKNPSLYFIRLATITVAGKPLGVSAVSYKVPTLIDSGTVITRLPASLYAALRGAFVKAISGKYPKAPAFSILDTCFKGKLASTSAVPLVQLVFAGGAELSLRAKNIVLQVDSGTFCLAFSASREIAIIGNHQQQTFKVAYDVSKSRIGFAPGGCS